MRETKVAQIEITASGMVQVLMHKLVDGKKYEDHRAVLEPGADIDQFAAMDAIALEADGFSGISPSDIARVKAFAAVAWPQEVVSAHVAEKAARNAELLKQNEDARIAIAAKEAEEKAKFEAAVAAEVAKHLKVK